MTLLHAFGLATLGRRCRRMVRITLRVHAEAETVFFEAPGAGKVESTAAALAALLRTEGRPPVVDRQAVGCRSRGGLREEGGHERR